VNEHVRGKKEKVLCCESMQVRATLQSLRRANRASSHRFTDLALS
jgi:hypothetical protein